MAKNSPMAQNSPITEEICELFQHKGVIITPSLRKPWFCESTHFRKSTEMALQSSKSDTFQKWSK